MTKPFQTWSDAVDNAALAKKLSVTAAFHQYKHELGLDAGFNPEDHSPTSLQRFGGTVYNKYFKITRDALDAFLEKFGLIDPNCEGAERNHQRNRAVTALRARFAKEGDTVDGIGIRLRYQPNNKKTATEEGYYFEPAKFAAQIGCTTRLKKVRGQSELQRKDYEALKMSDVPSDHLIQSFFACEILEMVAGRKGTKRNPGTSGIIGTAVNFLESPISSEVMLNAMPDMAADFKRYQMQLEMNMLKNMKNAERETQQNALKGGV